MVKLEVHRIASKAGTSREFSLFNPESGKTEGHISMDLMMLFTEGRVSLRTILCPDHLNVMVSTGAETERL